MTLRHMLAMTLLLTLVADRHDLTAQEIPLPPPILTRDEATSWLDNGQVRVGIDEARGGSIVWVSLSEAADGPGPLPAWRGVNLVNNWDHGRQIQPAFYSGPVPYSEAGQSAPPESAHLGWNPVPTGDVYGTPGRTLAHTNDGATIRTVCHPLQWPLRDVPAECRIEQTITLDGPAILVRGRLAMSRADRKLYPARLQELPAVYTNAPLHRIVSSTGPNPWTREPVTVVDDRPPPGRPWIRFLATEGWAAHVADDGFGLGVWSPTCVEMNGGFEGVKGAGGPASNAAGYLSPSRAEALDADLTYDFRYAILVGTVETIRAQAERIARRTTRLDGPLTWDFAAGRDGWTGAGVADAGMPWPGGWTVRPVAADPQLTGPTVCRPIAGPGRPPLDTLVVTAAVIPDGDAEGPIGAGEVFFAFHDRPEFDPTRTVPVTWTADGVLREVRIDLAGLPWWRGSVKGVRLDPTPGAAAATFRLHAVRLESSRPAPGTPD